MTGSIDVLLALLPIILTAAEVGLLIWVVIDLTRSRIDNKVLWTLIIIFAPVIGPIAYLIGRGNRK